MRKSSMISTLCCLFIVMYAGFAMDRGEAKVDDKERIEKLCRDKGINKPSYEKDMVFDKDGFLTALDLSYNDLNQKNINLKNFHGLKKLNLNRCNLRTLDSITFPDTIKSLDLNRNKNLKKVDLKNYTNLKKLNLTFCNIKDLSQSKLPVYLDKLDLSWNENLTKVDLKNYTNLKKLILNFCNISDLNLSQLTELTRLDILESKTLKKIDLTDSPKLQTLHFSINISELKKVLLHESNKTFPGITRIKYGRNKHNWLTSEEYFYNNEPKNKPGEKFAKRVYEYPGDKRIIIENKNEDQLKENNIIKTITTWALTIVTPLSIFYFVLGLILIQLYPRSEKLRDFISLTGWKKFITYSVKFTIIFLPPLRHKLISPFIETLMDEANLAKSAREETYYPGSNVTEITGEDETELKPISAAIRGIEGIIVLKGLSGLGKTMFVKNKLRAAKENFLKTRKIPVFLPARECKNGVIEAIQYRLRDSIIDEEKEIRKLVSNKTMIIFIDGLNEVDQGTRNEITRFLKDCDKGNILITTQLIDWQEPANAAVYKLMPLEENQIEEYLLTYENTYVEKEDRKDEYRTNCLKWVEQIKNELTTPAAARILSNPVDLRIVAQLLAKGEKLNEIDIFNLQEKQYDIMAERYKDQNNDRGFRQELFSKDIFNWTLNSEDYFLPGDLVDAYGPELTVMSSLKMILGTDKKLYFRHDKIKVFFLVKTFIKNRFWEDKENFSITRFNDVYFELGNRLPKEDAVKLGGLLASYAADTKDHSVSDEYIKIVRDRDDISEDSIFQF
ncbi:MAG: leucine-rich repeat domain-containing protein [bacterium]|nr:leucine-rich repeat domain-containing protein [bacterium]